MPVVILAVVMAMMAIVTLLVLFAAWKRVPTARWFAGATVLLFAGVIVAAVLQMRAARGDISEGVAQIKTGKATGKRTSGRRVTWYYTTLEGSGRSN